MIKNIFSMLLVLSAINLSSQSTMKLIFKDGSSTTGVFKFKGDYFKSKSSKKEYAIELVKNVVEFLDNDTIKYHVIHTKIYIDSKKSKMSLAIKDNSVTDGALELYYVNNTVSQFNAYGTWSFYNDKLAFVKKKDENIAYSLGYIYGAGYKGIKKRVRAYFIDCPDLIKKVDENEILKKDAKAIVDYYNEHCGS